MISFLKKIFTFVSQLTSLLSKLNEIKVQNGKILSEIKKNGKFSNINETEFKVFSQFGEDGLIQHLINNLKISKKCFVEFGVENYEEANTRFLLENNNWSGLIIDSSKKNINHIKKQNYYWRNDITAVCAFLSPKNINKILDDNSFNGNIGILSVDVDGNDYWILNSIEIISPDIIIIEYNANFGSEDSVTIKFKENFQRGTKGLNKLIYGCSIKAAVNLCNKKGYSLVCTNSNGNNAFFVKKNLLNEKIKAIDYQNAFNKNTFKEFNNDKGVPIKITDDQLKQIKNSNLLVKV
jgi:predicted DNA binding CopG/RHH family protein